MPAMHGVLTVAVHRPSLGRRMSLVLAIAGACVACEGRDVQVSGPKARDAFANYVAIGSDLSMGVQSGGVLYSSQQQAWPVLLARMAGADFSLPLLRSPGCLPPLIAPLGLGRLLSGATAAQPDSSCAGALGTSVPPLNNLALAGATAATALTVTPRTVAAMPSAFDAGDRGRYPIVLAPTQSQVSALLVKGASFVSIEFGLAEVLRAATSGLLVPAASYTQTSPWTYVPAAVFAPAYAAVADSVKKSGARVVLLSVPHVTRLAGMRPAIELWNARTGLSTYGVTVASDCNGSPNLIFTGAVVAKLAQGALTAGSSQILSCTDVGGALDAVLTPADVTALNAVVDQMNVQIRQLASTNGWAFADVDAVFSQFVATRAPYSASEHLACVYPYGAWVSLDGARPNLTGQQAIANSVATAVNATYGLDIPVPAAAPVTGIQLCP